MEKQRKPLTLEELRKMEGNPVLVEMKNEREREHNGVYISLYDKQMKAIRLWGVDGAWLRFSEKDMLVYAYSEPPHLDMEAWEPCEYCGGDVDDRPFLDSEDLYISGEGWITSDEQDHDFCKINFCPKCGRPLTDEAYQMLEKRIRG